MIIDAHFHPYFIEEICPEGQIADDRRQSMAYYKAPIMSMKRTIERIKASGVDRCFLLPYDYSTTISEKLPNEDIKHLVDLSEGKFYGFASIDPHSRNSLQELDFAFREMGFVGLKLHPSKQKFYPMDDCLQPIYDICIRFNKPIIFHAGFSWQPDAPAKYSHPMNFEEVAIKYPSLRFSLAHMGFPWVKETAMLLNKYPNIYTDTGALYFDSAQEFFYHLFTKEMSIGWVDRSLRHQVMYGSNTPRFEQMRMLSALKNVGFRDETLDLITCKNALEFIGEEEINWLS